MATTKELEGVVHAGTVILPEAAGLPEGAKVRVIWQEPRAADSPPYDRDPLTEEDVRADLQWADGKRFRQ